MNFAGVKRVADVLEPELAALGLETTWIPRQEVSGRAGHLFAEQQGSRGRRLLLIGHLDTVYEEDSPFQSFTREGDIARGPGILDMKGGVVVMLFALRALHEAGLLAGSSITVALIGDEENAGSPLAEARRHLIEAGIRSDVALEFENGFREDGQEFGTIARRSASGWSLRVESEPGHSANVFSEPAGYGAIFEAARGDRRLSP
jgi:glutamate carboxypeptidase